MVEYGGTFKDIMRLRYGKLKPTSQEIELFNAVSHLGESFNAPISTGSLTTLRGSLNGKVVIKRMDHDDTDHLVVYYEGREVFHITIGLADKITYYLPGEWEDQILKRYYGLA